MYLSWMKCMMKICFKLNYFCGSWLRSKHGLVLFCLWCLGITSRRNLLRLCWRFSFNFIDKVVTLSKVNVSKCPSKNTFYIIKSIIMTDSFVSSIEEEGCIAWWCQERHIFRVVFMVDTMTLSMCVWPCDHLNINEIILIQLQLYIFMLNKFDR